MTLYCIDTNSLVDLAVRRYPRQAFPALWGKIEDLIEEGRLISTEQVQAEIKRRDDDLWNWTKKHSKMFLQITEEVALNVRNVLAQHPKLVKTGKNRSMADPWVIAQARESRAIVVTEEEGGSENKPKIPSVCQALGVECISLVKLIIREGWTF